MHPEKKKTIKVAIPATNRKLYILLYISKGEKVHVGQGFINQLGFPKHILTYIRLSHVHVLTNQIKQLIS